MLGDKANITYIESLLNLHTSFETKIIYQKYLKSYIKNLTKGIDILISTRIDSDDIIYDAINDVRKEINIYGPMILHGYNRGVFYFEFENKYYEFYNNYYNNGTMSIFCSLILVLNQVYDIYTVYDIGLHITIIKDLLNNYKSYDLHYINYEPAIFDSGDVKFVYVRHNDSLTKHYTDRIKNRLKLCDFNLSKFYGR